MRRLFLSVAALLVLAAAAHAATPIADVKTIGANGELVNRGKEFTVAGIVTVASGTFNTVDLDFYVQDATAGINVIMRDAGYFKLDLGDSVLVTGTVDQGGTSVTRGNTNLRVSTLQNITVLGKATVPQPVVVTAAELSAAAQPPLETYEGKLVRLDRATINPADWPSAGAEKVITLTDATGTARIRIDRDTDIDGSAVPGQPFIVIGVVVQDDGTTPILSGYSIWPRSRQTDFLVMGNGSGLASIDPSVVETDVGTFDLRLTLLGNGIDTLKAFEVGLPLADGWTWTGQEVNLSGPGLAQASYEVSSARVSVSGVAIFDASGSYGVVTFLSVGPPLAVLTSTVTVSTSVDNVALEPIALQPSLRSVRPTPSVRINEVYPGIGQEDAFIELFNEGGSTAYLEGLALCEPRAVPYCDLQVRHVFGSTDMIGPGEYFVVARSASGFETEFGFAPDAEADISPLGRDVGDGAISSGIQSYEVISLWRDTSLENLIDFVEYRDAVACTADVCTGFGLADDGFPVVPPAGYSFISKTYDPCCPYEALSALPTPGADNVRRYNAPSLRTASALCQNTVEVAFSEPMDPQGLSDPANYMVGGASATAVYPSISKEKALVLFPVEQAEDSVRVAVRGLRSWAGVDASDVVLTVGKSADIYNNVCTVQASDENGYSPLNGVGATVLGFITVPPRVFQPDYQSIYVQGLDGCGVNVFSYDVSSPLPRMGDLVRITGNVEEYVSATAGSTTELFMAAPTGLAIKATGYPEPPPQVMSTGEVGKEENEGRLIQTEGLVVTASELGFYLDDGTGGVQIYQNYTPIDYSRFAKGMYIRVKGVILQYDYTLPFFDGYELVPRYESDIDVRDDVFLSKPTIAVDARVFCPSCGDEGFAIRFGVPNVSYTVVRIFDAAGREVTTLYSGDSAGEREITWTGRDQDGKPVPPGLYICHVEARDLSAGSDAVTAKTAPVVVGTKLR